MTCEEFLNSFVLLLYEGVGKLEKSQFSQTNLSLKICWEAINSKSCSLVFVPDKMLELEVDTKRLNSNDNLEFMPFGKSFLFMPFRNYTIWEVTAFCM